MKTNASHGLHLNLSSDTLKKFNELNIADVGELEQCLATAISNDGKFIHVKNLRNRILEFIRVGVEN